MSSIAQDSKHFASKEKGWDIQSLQSSWDAEIASSVCYYMHVLLDVQTQCEFKHIWSRFSLPRRVTLCFHMYKKTLPTISECLAEVCRGNGTAANWRPNVCDVKRCSNEDLQMGIHPTFSYDVYQRIWVNCWTVNLKF